MFNVFGYLRNQAKAAVLGGISDALAEVATDDRPADLDGLRKLLATAGEAKALPPAAPPADVEAGAEPAKGKKAKGT